jgi:ABC-type lipoprotein release transport system permease subunit
MLLKLAWRNIWRNRRRSLIVLTAIVIGMVLLMLTESYTAGMLKQMMSDQIGSHVAHLQIHRKGFNDNKIIQNSVPDPGSVEAALRRLPMVAAYSRRVVTYGLISSASNSSGVSIIGIDPEQEQYITKIKSWVFTGRYLTRRDREIVLGKDLAERLGVAVGDKIVLMASALDGQVSSDVFRISGVYESTSNEFDRMFVYVPLGNAQRMLGLGDRISEFAVLSRSIEDVPSLNNQLIEELGEKYEVLNYADLLPALVAIVDVAGKTMGIYYLIIGAATIFGIINTLLMSVFERIREFGVLMAMGMKNGKVFSMVLLEAFVLGVVGMMAGLVVGLACYYPMWKYGLDLSSFAEGLKMVGVSVIVHPLLTPEALVRILLIIPLISVLAALYPAAKAVRLVPVRAIYYV